MITVKCSEASIISSVTTVDRTIRTAGLCSRIAIRRASLCNEESCEMLQPNDASVSTPLGAKASANKMFTCLVGVDVQVLLSRVSCCMGSTFYTIPSTKHVRQFFCCIQNQRNAIIKTVLTAIIWVGDLSNRRANKWQQHLGFFWSAPHR